LGAVANEASTDPADTLPPGTVLGRYQIVRAMGRGGMGAVYEATHLDLKKRVAIKTLHPAVAALPGARSRFLREGEAASRIRHPNVVDVTDMGSEGGTAYLVMEYLEGEDLAGLLARSGPLSFSDSVDILVPVVAAIAVAHEEGVIHRDLKPENVFMARTRHDGAKPTVLDFGISKISSSGGGSTLALTGTGASMGTPYYIAPEQIRGAAAADARSDQYALGAILYEVVTGQRAHRGETIYEVIHSVGGGLFTLPHVYRPDIPPALEGAILRAMKLEPTQRFPSVQAFGRAILEFASAAIRHQWTPALAGGDGKQVSPRSAHTTDPQPGGTVLLPASASGLSEARVAAARSRSGPTPNTTFGASAAQITLPVGRRPGRLTAAFVVLVGGALAAYFIAAAPARRHIAAPRSIASDSDATSAGPAPASPMPARYRVSVIVNPVGAHIDLDGKSIGTGRIAEELAVDGSDHTLTISAPGFVPTRLTFRDHPPPEDVTLEPVAAAEVKPSAGRVRTVQVAPGEQEHDARHRTAAKRVRSAPVRSENGASINGAPIIDE
jgi:eukaryotic-like serine/threonine-protein kinase